MATPTADSYSASAGTALVRGGRNTYPAWRQGLTPLTLVAISGSAMIACPDAYTAPAGKSKSGIYAYSGGALDASRSRLWRAGGGHSDSAGNEVMMLDLAAASPVWRLQRAPTAGASIGIDVSYYSDGRPSSRHTYWHIQYNAQRDRLMLAAASAVYGSGNAGFTAMDAFDPAIGDWEPAGTYVGTLSSLYASPCWQDESGNIFTHNPTSGEIRRWNNAANTAATVRTGSAPFYETAYGYDPVRKIAVRFFNGGAASGYLNHNVSTLPFVQTAVTGPAAAVFEPGGAGNHRYCITYDQHLDCFWVIKRYDPTKLYKVTVQGSGPYTLNAEEIALSGVSFNWYASGGDASNTYGAFAYVPALRGIVWNYAYSANTLFVPTA